MGKLLDQINGTSSYMLTAQALSKGGPFVGPKGGKWADAKHTIAWKEGKSAGKQRKHAHAGSTGGWHSDHKNTTADQHDVLQRRHNQAATGANHEASKHRKNSNAEFAHRYERDYHLAMADAHGSAKVGLAYRSESGKLAPDDKSRVDSALSSARRHKRDHMEASASVEANKPPTNGRGDVASMGNTATGKPMAFLSRENFRDHTHGWSEADHKEAASEHRARAEHKWALSDLLQGDGNYEEAAKHGKAGRYHDQMHRTHEAAVSGTRSDPGDRGNKAQAEHARSVSSTSGRMSDMASKANPQPETTMSKDTMSKAGGPFIGARGGKWADPQHKIPYNDKKHAGKPAPKAREHDEHGATELQLHIENTAGHQNQHESIRDNLAKKIAGGKYDHAQASKLFQYLADSGSKQYAKEHGSGSGHAMDVPTRQAAARQMAHEFHDEVKYGEHDHRVSSGVHAKRAKAGGGLAAMAHAHGSGNAKKSEPTRRIAANLPYDDHIMSFYEG